MEVLNQIGQHLVGQGTRCCAASNAKSHVKIYALGLKMLQWAPGVFLLSRLTPRLAYASAIGESVAHFTVWPALEAKKKISCGHRRAHMIHEALMWSFMIAAIKHVRADRWSLVVPLDLVMTLQMLHTRNKTLGVYSNQEPSL